MGEVVMGMSHSPACKYNRVGVVVIDHRVVDAFPYIAGRIRGTCRWPVARTDFPEVLDRVERLNRYDSWLGFF